MSIFHKRADLTDQQFRSHWKEVHAPVAITIPGLSMYEQNLVLEAIDLGHDLPRGTPQIDGVCKLAFEDESAMQNVLTPRMTRILMEDEARFMDGLRTAVIGQRTLLPVNGPAGLKCISFATRRAELSPDAFERGWADAQARRVQALPGLRGYAQNHVTRRTIARQPATYEEWPLDCIDEMWFDDQEALRSAFASPAGRELLQQTRVWAAAMSSFIVAVHAPLAPAPRELASGRAA